MQYLIPEAHNEQNSSSRLMGTNQQFNVNQSKKKKKYFCIEGKYWKEYPMLEWQNQVCGKHVQMTFIKIHFLFIFPF